MSGTLYRQTPTGLEAFAPSTTADRVRYGDGTVADALDGASYAHPLHAARAKGLYKVAVDALGHVDDASAVTLPDLIALGVSDAVVEPITNEELEAMLR